MKLKNYAPTGNELLLELKEYSQSAMGVVLVKPDQEKMMKVLAVGPTVTLLNPLTGTTVKPGDYVMPTSPNLLQLTFTLEDNTKVQTVQVKEFGISGCYKPDTDETKFFVQPGKSDVEYPVSRDLNIIDNPGIDKSPYLKEEALNKTFLDSNS